MNWKKIFLLPMLTLFLAFPSLSMAESSTDKVFSDVSEKSVHYEAIMRLVENESITGYKDGTFKPYKDISRQHVAVILARELELSAPDNKVSILSTYDDVDESYEYADEIAAATEEGIFNGSHGVFMPEDSITREQLASVFYRGFELQQYKGDVNSDPIYLDNVDASHKEAVKSFGSLGLTTQLDDFHPANNLKRAQFASFLNNVTTYITNNATTLGQKLDAIVESELPAWTINGISVRNAETGEQVYSHTGIKQLRPASNMKLLTSSAALETLGPDYRFSTEVLSDANLSGSTLEGNLYLKGKGDPTLVKEDFDNFADELKNKGIEEIAGDIIGDDTWYDDVRFPLDMPWSDEAGYYGAPISALTMSPNDDYDTGTVIVEVKPAAVAGEPAEVSTVPETDQIVIVNNAETVEENKSNSISVEREHGTNDIVVEGNMPAGGGTDRTWSTVWTPTEYTVDVFKKSLEEKGIKMNANASVKRGKTPKGAEKLLSSKSMTLEDILIPFMKLSNNGHAEMLTKEMGVVEYGEGTWGNGLQVINDVATDLEMNENLMLLRDGSGISDKTLITAEELTRLLYTAQERDWFPQFENALPVAGESERLVGGTLRNRMTGESTKGNVMAKTGSITGASALSGYVTTKDGEKLIFSILNNNFKTTSMTEIQDKLVTVLAEHKESEQ